MEKCQSDMICSAEVMELRRNIMDKHESKYIREVIKNLNELEKKILERNAKEYGMSVIRYVRYCCISEPISREYFGEKQEVI